MRGRRRKKSRLRKGAETAGDALECGCCLADLFVVSVAVGGLVAWRRARR